MVMARKATEDTNKERGRQGQDYRRGHKSENDDEEKEEDET